MLEGTPMKKGKMERTGENEGWKERDGDGVKGVEMEVEGAVERQEESPGTASQG